MGGMPTSTPAKVRENRLRRMADRQQLVLHKIRRLDPYASDYGRYTLRRPDPAPGEPGIAGDAMTLDEVEAYLTADPTTRDRP